MLFTLSFLCGIKLSGRAFIYSEQNPFPKGKIIKKISIKLANIVDKKGVGVYNIRKVYN